MFIRTCLILAAVLSVIGSAGASAQDDPTVEEEKFFDAVRSRLQNLPKPIAAALTSISIEGFQKVFPCPPDSRDQYVRLVVSTELKMWDARAARHSDYALSSVRKPETDEVTIIIDDRVTGLAKLVLFTNELRLNAGYMRRGEGNIAGKIANEIVLYHELFHTQLFIQRAVDEVQKQLPNLCVCKDFEVTPALAGDTDVEHTEINPLEDAYGRNNSGRGIEYARRDFTYTGGRTGLFTLKVNTSKTIQAGAAISAWHSENISELTWSVGATTNEVIVEGRITGNKPAYVKLLIEPEMYIEAVGITILPPARRRAVRSGIL